MLICHKRFSHRPHTDHIQTTYQPHTDHVPTTYRPHTDHVPTVQLVSYYPQRYQIPRIFRSTNWGSAVNTLLHGFCSTTESSGFEYYFGLGIGGPFVSLDAFGCIAEEYPCNWSMPGRLRLVRCPFVDWLVHFCYVPTLVARPFVN